MNETATAQPTHESIVDDVCKVLRRRGALPSEISPTPWDSFISLSNEVHKTFEVPGTTFTPIMRRLLFALSFAARPSFVVGVGTYVGYTFSWIVRNRSDSKAGPFCDKAIGIDIDTKANKLARRNSASLGHGERLEFLDGDAVSILSELNLPIDLLYIDLDHPATGKRAYPEVLEVAVSKLRSGALVLAHDACVRKFRQDFDRYHNYVRASGLFAVSCVLPVDNCGLSVAAMR